MKNWERYKRLKKCRKNFLARFHDIDQINVMNKICRRYFFHGVMFGQKDIVVVFGGKYLRSFRKRVDDWVYFFRKTIKYIGNRTIKRKWGKLIKPYKPIHIKIANVPNEAFMEEFLMSAGFEVKDEILETIRSIYIIGPEYPDF